LSGFGTISNEWSYGVGGKVELGGSLELPGGDDYRRAFGGYECPGEWSGEEISTSIGCAVDTSASIAITSIINVGYA